MLSQTKIVGNNLHYKKKGSSPSPGKRRRRQEGKMKVRSRFLKKSQRQLPEQIQGHAETTADEELCAADREVAPRDRWHT